MLFPFGKAALQMPHMRIRGLPVRVAYAPYGTDMRMSGYTVRGRDWNKPWILHKASPGKKSNLRPGYCTAGCTGFWLGLAAGWVFWAEFGALVSWKGRKRVREKRKETKKAGVGGPALNTGVRRLSMRKIGVFLLLTNTTPLAHPCPSFSAFRL